MKKLSPGKVVVGVILVAYTIIQLYPLFWLFCFSLKDNGEIFGGNVMGLPQKWIWANYGQALFQANVGTYLFNSVIVTGLTILITMAVSCMAAFAITRMRWKLSGAFLLFVTMGMMIPVHASLLPLFLTMGKIGILNTRVSLILPYVGFAIPLAVNVLANFFRTIPTELEEAACIDGCNIYQIFYKIMLPMVLPAIATVSIFTYLASWNELMFASTFVNKQEIKTLTVGVMSMVGQYSTRWGPIGAGLVVATVPSLVAYMFVSSQLPNSISSGAVKG